MMNKINFIYKGRRQDIIDAEKVLNFSELNALNRNYRANIISDIKVNIYDSLYDLENATKEYKVDGLLAYTIDNEMYILNEEAVKFIYGKDYKIASYNNYLRCQLMHIIMNNINTRCSDEIIEAVCIYESGQYHEKNDLIKYDKSAMTLVEYTITKQGYRKMLKILTDSISNADIPKMIKDKVKELFKEEYIEELTNQQMQKFTDPKKLMNSMKRKFRKQKYELNAIKKSVSTTDIDINAYKNTEERKEMLDKRPVTSDNVKHIKPTKITPPADTAASKGEENTGDMASVDDKPKEEKMEKVSEATMTPLFHDQYKSTEEILQHDNILYVYPDAISEQLLLEDKKHNPMLKKILYRERLRTPKEVFAIYDKVKEDNPWIKRTFLNYRKYKEFNTFIDLSFYNQTFFKNNTYKLDKGVNLYFDFITRFIKDQRLSPAGYNKTSILVPVSDWVKPDTKFWMYTEDINPISLIIRLMKKDMKKIKEAWSGIPFVFLGNNGYFKVEFDFFDEKDIPKFIILLKKIASNEVIEDPIDEPKESPKAIVANIVDTIEKNKGIEINDISADSKEIKDLAVKKITKGLTGTTPEEKELPEETEAKPADKKEENEKLKADMVKSIAKAAAVSNTTDEALDNIEDENYLKNILDQLQAEEEDKVKINAARSARINKLEKEFLDKKINKKPIKEIINTKEVEELPSRSIKVDSINAEWNDLKAINFTEVYDPQEDILKAIHSLSKKSVPVSVRDIKVEDTSTSEDLKETYTVQMEDVNGKRFTIKFDVPKLKNNKFMMLRGNEKTMNSQLTLIPIIKTDEDTVQVVSDYNKIFIRRFGTTTGKSYPVAGRIIKALSKLEGKQITVTPGDNTMICKKYDLPIDYIDLASQYSKIETTYHTFIFNIDELIKNYNVDMSKGIPVAIYKKDKTVKYWNSEYGAPYSTMLFSMLAAESSEFADVYKSTSVATRYTYSKASILNSEIPLIVIMGYNEGLMSAMKKANIKFEIVDNNKSYDKNTTDSIKFKDGYIRYELDYNSSLLMNGLKECNTEDYSIAEINNKSMFLEFLDLFGGKIKADGLDNFYDLMVDPVMEEVLNKYKLPTDYIEILAYANMLLADNKYIRHTDTAGRRLRNNELIAGYVYKALSESYGNYRVQLKRNKSEATMTMKQTIVIDKILADSTTSDLSVLNPLLEAESMNTVSYKGLSGMNSERSYGLDKRTYDESMINVLGMSTGFAGNVGVNRQATIDTAIQGKRGYIKTTDDPSNLNVTKTLTVTEALTPFGTTRDDPFRSAMNFVQTSKHGMRIKDGDPMLISCGADEALPYMITDTFAFKAKDNGKIIEKTDRYLVIQYDNGASDFVSLENTVKKNSNGGFYVDIKLDSDLKVGNRVKKNDIVAYDKLSFSNKMGSGENISYSLGALTKIAILNTDEGFEDSAIISKDLSEKMTSEVIVKKDKVLPKNTNLYYLASKGQAIQEGEPLMIFQNAFDEEDVNMLLKTLGGEDGEEISELGRINFTSKITGKVEDVVAYRTVDKSELSDSLKKKIDSIEKPMKEIKKVMEKYDIEAAKTLNVDTTLDPSGKLKNAQDAVLIEFYLKYEDKMSVGDKLIYYSALKGVVKDIFPEGKEPFSDFRKDEKIHSLLSVGSVNGRMVGSVLSVGAVNKVLIELERKVKEIAGIKPNIK